MFHCRTQFNKELQYFDEQLANRQSKLINNWVKKFSFWKEKGDSFRWDLFFKKICNKQMPNTQFKNIKAYLEKEKKKMKMPEKFLYHHSLKKTKCGKKFAVLIFEEYFNHLGIRDLLKSLHYRVDFAILFWYDFTFSIRNYTTNFNFQSLFPVIGHKRALNVTAPQKTVYRFTKNAEYKVPKKIGNWETVETKFRTDTWDFYTYLPPNKVVEMLENTDLTESDKITPFCYQFGFKKIKIGMGKRDTPIPPADPGAKYIRFRAENFPVFIDNLDKLLDRTGKTRGFFQKGSVNLLYTYYNQRRELFSFVNYLMLAAQHKHGLNSPKIICIDTLGERYYRNLFTMSTTHREFDLEKIQNIIFSHIEDVDVLRSAVSELEKVVRLTKAKFVVVNSIFPPVIGKYPVKYADSKKEADESLSSRSMIAGEMIGKLHRMAVDLGACVILPYYGFGQEIDKNKRFSKYSSAGGQLDVQIVFENDQDKNKENKDEYNWNIFIFSNLDRIDEASHEDIAKCEIALKKGNLADLKLKKITKFKRSKIEMKLPEFKPELIVDKGIEEITPSEPEEEKVVDYENELEVLEYLKREFEIGEYDYLIRDSHVVSLKIRNRNLTRIPEKIRYLTHLQALDLACNQISEIEYLEHLSQLQSLELWNNRIKQINGLDRLSRLWRLNLSSNNIKKIEGLDRLLRLEVLDLSQNKISKIKGLGNLIELKRLNLADNNINKIEGLDKQINLHELCLQKNRIEQIEGFDDLFNLHQLYLHENNIENINELKRLRNLGIFWLHSNLISNIEKEKLPHNLESLIISNNPREEIEVENSIDLETYEIDRSVLSKITDLQPDSERVNIIVQVIEKLNERVVQKDQIDQQIADFLVGDETGTYILTAWNEHIKLLEEHGGTAILIRNSYVNTFKGQSKLNIGLYSHWEPLDIKIPIITMPKIKIENLKKEMSRLNLIIKVERIDPQRIVKFKDGSLHKTATALVGDHTAVINLSLFDDTIDQFEIGEIYELRNVYVNQFQDHLQLNIGRFGENKNIEHEPIKVNLDKYV